MARKKINTMLRTPDGIANLLLVDVVTPTDKGVAMVRGDNLMCWVEVPDPTLRSEISMKISDCLLAAKSGENFEQINWADYGLAVGGKPAQRSTSEGADGNTAASGNKHDVDTEVEAEQASVIEQPAVEHETAL